MKLIFRVIATVLIVLSLLMLTKNPFEGILGLAIGVVLYYRASKLPR